MPPRYKCPYVNTLALPLPEHVGSANDIEVVDISRKRKCWPVNTVM